ncbi:Phosphodiest-domain-containing protein [Schizophyllum commune H4-8]|uniref:Phosphodiest-domain-containing protein n=1 Tax=Schizophyllum commune (strain H4-8 / FGSC 9210) TaxID=578458 RepID=UPI002160AAD9|nr:Phosphodiest-domain-containing protein [Schizophyllum commune H4-8]KAI5899371.1 Phosphodiest-domain-containing protein [Schizophyllum commune H4-8]
MGRKASKQLEDQRRDYVESKGLLSGDIRNDLSDVDREGGARPAALRASSFIFHLITGVFARAWYVELPPPQNSYTIQDTGDLRSNDTHEFRWTVLIVSIDGLSRADYLDRSLTPHLLDIRKQGLRAKSMTPISPLGHNVRSLGPPYMNSLYAPCRTGLQAESHAIVANNFWDPSLKTEFKYNSAAASWDPAWWYGEPREHSIGAPQVLTATQARPSEDGLWRQSDVLRALERQGAAPGEARPDLRVDRPAFEGATTAYHGVRAISRPMSALVNKTFGYVDTFAKDLATSLAARNLTSIVDVVFISDHGMTDTSNPEFIYVDDILGSDGMKAIAHVDGWPSMGIRWKEGASVTEYLGRLEKAADALEDGAFDVFTHETMPQRWYFAGIDRIAPVYVVPEMGYALTTHEEGEDGMCEGNHGYDNREQSMHAVFVAHGPFTTVIKALHQSRDTLARRWLSRPNKGWHITGHLRERRDLQPRAEALGRRGSQGAD